MPTNSRILGSIFDQGDSSQRRFAHLDSLRAVAILIVVASHSTFGEVIQGGLGVTIFFVISGFIITHLLLAERDKTGAFDIKGFFYRRFTKIGPPLLVTVLMPGLLFSVFYWGSIIDWLSQVFFFFNWLYLDDQAAVIPGSSVVWSLSIEEQFYIAFALIWLAIAKSANALNWLTVGSAAVAVLSAGARILLYFNGASGTRIYYGSDTRFEAIAIGVLLAALMHRAAQQPKAPISDLKANAYDLGLIAAIVVLVATANQREPFFVETWRYSVQAIAAASIIFYGFQNTQTLARKVFNRVVSNRGLLLIGVSSYSTYLTHLMLIYALDTQIKRMPTLAKAAIFIGVALAVGIALYYLIEKPIAIYKARRRLQK